MKARPVLRPPIWRRDGASSACACAALARGELRAAARALHHRGQPTGATRGFGMAADALHRDKYGTGFTSIHQREAPDHGRLLKWNASTTFRAAAMKSSHSVLRQACCTQHQLGSHRMVLFVGDSQAQAIYEHLCNPSRRRLLVSKATAWNMAAEQCLNSSTLAVFIVAAGKWAKHFPSFHTAGIALGRLPKPPAQLHPNDAIWTPTAVVHNFAAPHMLHVHPVRPFFDADSSKRPRCYPQSTCADYRGLQNLDAWIRSDLSAYRQRLGPKTRLVVVTPNWICDAKLYTSYQRQMGKPLASRFSACHDWMRQRLPTAPSEEVANDFCSNFTFTAAGTERMAGAMAMAVARVEQHARVLDVTALTRGRCDATDDARHYPKLVPTQARALLQLLA